MKPIVIRENLKGYVPDEMIERFVRNEKLFNRLESLDFQTIFNCITCLTDSGYKLTKKEESCLTRLITIQKIVETPITKNNHR